MVTTAKKHIVIIGAGFAGLKLARELNNHPFYSITLIDKNNYHQFQPLLYQVAMANLDASNISFPLRAIFMKSKNVRIKVSNVIAVNTVKNSIETDSGTLEYDYLVVATGTTTNYFGNTSIEKQAFSMKSTLEALQIRNTIFKYFEDAANKKTNNKEPLSIIIVGGGPTGVELSGALAEMKKDSLPLEYPELDFKKMKIYLLEGGDKLLSNMSSISSKKAKDYLEHMGVIIKTNAVVKNYDGISVILKDDSVIKSSIVIWAAGVKGTLPKGFDPAIISKSNQIKTDIYGRVASLNNVFAIGDIALLETESHPKGFPQLASVAVAQAKTLATNFKRVAEDKTMQPFHYINKGNLATVGRNKAVVDLARPKLSFQGFFAWLIWMTLHLFLLMGFKNKLVVFINWAYKYFTHQQSLSLLFQPLARATK